MARALITGCSTGIGRAAAVELTKRGYDVVATARRPEVLDDLDVAAKLRLDVDDDASVRDAVAAAGDVDVLVNNAGWGIHAPVETVPIDAVKALFETNVFGVLRMVQAVLPGMRERGGGTIVNVSSISGRVSAPLGGLYSASKFALEAISEALHYEAGRFGIRTILIEPGGFDTGFGDNRRVLGLDGPPYDELDRIWEGAQAKLQGPVGSRPGPEVVAQTIADAIEADPPKLRWLVGDDAKLVMDVRGSMSDEDFEATMRATLGLDW